MARSPSRKQNINGQKGTKNHKPLPTDANERKEIHFKLSIKELQKRPPQYARNPFFLEHLNRKAAEKAAEEAAETDGAGSGNALAEMGAIKYMDLLQIVFKDNNPSELLRFLQPLPSMVAAFQPMGSNAMDGASNVDDTQFNERDSRHNARISLPTVSSTPNPTGILLSSAPTTVVSCKINVR